MRRNIKFHTQLQTFFWPDGDYIPAFDQGKRMLKVYSCQTQGWSWHGVKNSVYVLEAKTAEIICETETKYKHI